MNSPTDFIMLPIPVADYRAVCAVLAGVSVANLAAPIAAGNEIVQSSDPAPAASTATTNVAAASDASESSSEGDLGLDAHGHPWNAELHASTKGQTKDGLWRLKPGASRPDPMPGYPKEAGEEAAEEAAADAIDAEPGNSPDGGESSPTAEDDEFAAFRDAADEGEPEPVERKWTEADMSKLCNQAAVKLGDPGPIKNIIAKYVPEGETPHSRNIPDDQREAFAQEVESKAGIEFDG